MKLRNTDVMTNIKNVAMVIIGTMVLAFGSAVFIIPFNLVTGGITGISLILDKILPFEFITVNLLVTIVTWTLFILGAVVLGKGFAAKTLVSTIVYPVAIALFSKLVSPEVMGGFFVLRDGQYSEIAVVLAVLFGPIITGTGCAIAFLGGGSTGGIDVIAFIICKAFKKLRTSHVLFAISATTIALGAFVFKNLIIALLGIVVAFVETSVIDKVFLGGEKAFVAHIYSNNSNEINEQVIKVLNRTTTIVSVVGGYSGKESKMLTVSFTMRQYGDLMNIIHNADKKAFVTIQRVHQVNGEGWQ
jgi:uncharacterized membrane-anchored protein YitT (DUF2179 family)